MPLEDFAAVPASVAEVRAFVRSALSNYRSVDDVVLVASELATNVVRHARTDYTVEIEPGSTVSLKVSDGSSIVPAVQDLTADQRGLRILEALTDDWGIEVKPSGKTVWATFTS